MNVDGKRCVVIHFRAFWPGMNELTVNRLNATLSPRLPEHNVQAVGAQTPRVCLAERRRKEDPVKGECEVKD